MRSIYTSAIDSIYFVRHGATKLNRECGSGEDRIRGHMDIPLAEEGRREASLVAGKLRSTGIGCIFSSDLSRATETARIIATEIGANLITLYGLRPWKLGPTIEGGLSREMLPVIKRFFEQPERRPFGGESFLEFEYRVFATLAEIGRQGGGKRLAVVTHYRCMQLLDARGTDNLIDARKFLSAGSRTGTIRVLAQGKLSDFED